MTVQPAQRWRQILRDALLDAADVARRDLSDDQIRGLLRTEVDERLAAADEVGAGGRTERAATPSGRGGLAQRPSRRCLTAVPGWARAAH